MVVYQISNNYIRHEISGNLLNNYEPPFKPQGYEHPNIGPQFPKISPLSFKNAITQIDFAGFLYPIPFHRIAHLNYFFTALRPVSSNMLLQVTWG